MVLQSQVPKGMKGGVDFATQMEETLKKYCKEVMLTAEDIYDVEKRQPPRFVTHIKDVQDLKEMEEYTFDCQLAPVGDPNMKVEWFFNGRPLPFSKCTLIVTLLLFQYNLSGIRNSELSFKFFC